MNSFRLLFLASLSVLAESAVAQVVTVPPGAYRTAVAYRHRRPQPAGVEASYPDKRGQLVVTVPNGPRTQKIRLATDSLWGYVTGKGRTHRFYRGGEYQLETSDTLAIYSSSDIQPGTERNGTNVATPGASAMGQYTAPRYYFSVGLTGLIFPLTPRYLREMYEASNPAFVKAVTDLGFSQSLSDFNSKTGRYRVSDLYRQSTP
ncbi:hypothetical protein [Hymenobacter rubidus]|uniref:hypothetical protein n=1 Tax=Hymenobacter rubidus TaxID=1441626 RepID=UPI00191E26F3|nr:hypothetical protein [Hymenobacter rubidus]